MNNAATKLDIINDVIAAWTFNAASVACKISVLEFKQGK